MCGCACLLVKLQISCRRGAAGGKESGAVRSGAIAGPHCAWRHQNARHQCGGSCLETRPQSASAVPEACAVTPGGEPHSSTHAAGDPNASLAFDTHPTPQRCFLKGGALATCCHSEAVLLRRINRLAAARKWAAVVVTQDWHPPGHISFASAFPGAAPFSSVNLTYAPDGALLGVDGNATSAGANDTTISQVLWPEHCVANTSGASLAAGLAVPQGANVISLLKGRDSSIDDYRLAPAAGGDQ